MKLTDLLILLLFFASCDNLSLKQENKDSEQKTAVVQTMANRKIYVDPDSLIVKIPGKNTAKKAEVVISNIPEKEQFKIADKIIPGRTYLPLSEQDKIEGKIPLKSKIPVIRRLNDNNYVKTKYGKPIKSILPKPFLINSDSISLFEKYTKNFGLISVQHGDSIFPPVALYMAKPIRTRALDFKYKDDAIYDIAFLGENQEIPNSYIRKMAKDKQGVIWLSTHTGGLISYDGQYFDQYLEQTALSSNQALAMCIDGKDRIWLGTENAGVNCLDGNKVTQYTVKQGLPSNYILSMLEDSKGRMWFGTAKGLACLSADTLEVYTTKQGLIMNAVFSLLEDKSGNLWIGTYGKGLQKWDGKEFTTYTTKDGLAGDLILSLCEDHKRNIWIGAQGGGVSCYTGNSFINYSVDQGLGNPNVLSIVESEDNKLWFGTFGNGVTSFDGKAFMHFTTNEGMNDNFIRTLFNDGSGNLWIGTDGSGISKFRLNGFKHLTKKQGLEDKLIASVYQDNKGRICMGAFDKGIMISNNINHNEELKNYIHISSKDGLVNDIVTYIIQDNNKNYWFGTYGGGVSKLDYKSLNNGKIKLTNYTMDQGLLSDFIRDIKEDDDGNIWFATKGGATKYDGEKFITITKKAGLASNAVVSLFIDSEKSIWFGTRGGGVARLENDSLTNFNNLDGLANNTVWAINQDKNGIMWFGTDGGGLSYFNGIRFNTINTDNGLCNNFVFSLNDDENNNLWVGTTKGLSKIKLPIIPDKNIVSISYDDPLIINYGKKDGLKSLDFYQNSAMIDKNNEIWFGTVNALSVLDLNLLNSNVATPVVHLNNIFINDRKLDFTKREKDEQILESEGIEYDSIVAFLNYPLGLRLPHNLNHLTFNFVAINWESPNNLKYQFKLEGFDNKWNRITNKTSADYRNLPSGNYTFKLRTKGNYDKWSGEFQYSFIIKTPWWHTWWAYIIYLIAIASFIWLIVSWRVSIIRKQNVVLEKMVVKRTQQLNTALADAQKATMAKSQFVARMSHEIRTPLTAILGFTKLLINIKTTSKQSDYLTKINRSANTMLSLINEILDFSKMESGKMELEQIPFDIEILLNSVIILNYKQIHDKSLELVIRVAPEVPKVIIGDSLRLGQIITNLINNAVKFTQKGEIVMEIKLIETTAEDEILLQFEVKDSGVGIDEDQIPFLFDEFQQADNSITRRYGGSGLGLTICKSLVSKMQGEIWVESKQGFGSSFFFTIKLKPKTNQLPNKKILPEELQGLSVLVYDKSVSSLSNLKAYLDDISCKTTAVESRVQLLNKLDKIQYNLAIIDLETCEVGGFEEFVKILNENAHGALKTILISCSEEKMNLVFDSNSNFDALLLKPILPTALFEKILSVFGMEDVFCEQQEKHIELTNLIDHPLCCNKILLAEDNEINSQLIADLLQNVGVFVDLADNGATAVKKTMKEDYDLIIMDLHMPIMDGFYAAMQIRKHNSKVPIIAITADAIHMVHEKCEQSGFNDVVSKPINNDIFFNTLLKWTSPKEDIRQHSYSVNITNSNSFDGVILQNIDAESGIRRFGGNETLFFSLLKKFMKNNNNISENILKLMKDSEFEKAHLIIHNLKGESANIGAEQIYDQSKIVEGFVLSKNITKSEEELKLLDKYLNEVLSELHTYFDGKLKEVSEKSISMVQLINNLMKYLKVSNPKALDLMDQLNENCVLQPFMENLNSAVNSGDNDVACDILENIKKELS